eukprot:979875-Pyramimonas_sp.AAC.1
MDPGLARTPKTPPLPELFSGGLFGRQRAKVASKTASKAAKTTTKTAQAGQRQPKSLSREPQDGSR